jgi:hypothetical protein
VFLSGVTHPRCAVAELAVQARTVARQTFAVARRVVTAVVALA